MLEARQAVVHHRRRRYDLEAAYAVGQPIEQCARMRDQRPVSPQQFPLIGCSAKSAIALVIARIG